MRVRTPFFPTSISIFAGILATVLSPQVVAQTLPGIHCNRPNDSRCEDWLTVIDYPENYPLTFVEANNGLAISADGKTAYVTGHARDEENPFNSGSVGIVGAIDVETGQTRWLTTIAPTAYVNLSGIATANDGTVLVTGNVGDSFLAPDTAILVAALNPEDGTVRWQKVVDPSPSTDIALDIASGQSKAGKALAVVTGWVSVENQPRAAYTLAFSTNGVLQWAARYDRGRGDLAWDVELSHGQAFVVIQSLGRDSPYDLDIVTLTYDLDGGDLLWVNRFKGSEAGAQDKARTFAVSPDGRTVVVAGYSNAAKQGPPYAVDFDATLIAYDTQSGERLWIHRWRASDHFLQWTSATDFPVPSDIVVTGERVIFSAVVENAIEKEGLDIATVALDRETGYFEWVAIESALGADLEIPNGLAASPDSRTVVVIGHRVRSDTRYLYAGQAANGAQIAIAYATKDGSIRWKAQLRYSQIDSDSGQDVVITPDGTVITMAQLTRNIQFERDFYDIGLAAYRTQAD